ncbi:hypothetical protein [Dickeya solani]|uniref:Uncharacterized protein n=1 Tax=Dickeya solani TaxID=1089444 RepID=A0ABU4EI47_9GAMM|nr:hypothetical protein [Dickeya solani]MCA7001603.1 hypothetical protein [Dickeya solani]MCZ0820753.1 hypothetical protein [Dickeya solani]MDV6996979.1 hypothetical protein [Dickeya solani]MDV7002549.1 hypothetical protein [Dickeya solani]MDV7038801.1 hypothetical protein [Dickeya solani]
MDAVKARAVPDKNAGSVFEQAFTLARRASPWDGASNHVMGGPNSEVERRRNRVSGTVSLASGQGEAAFEPLLVVRAMKLQRNYTVYPARNHSLI